MPAFLRAHVPGILAAALMASETRPRCDAYGDGLMLNLRGVHLTEDGPSDQIVAVRMWVTPKLVMTVRLRVVFALKVMRELANVGKTPVQDDHDAETDKLHARNGYVLSLVAAVFLPLDFITGLFGVNVGGMPGVESAWGFAILCISMVVMTLLAVWVLRRMRWL